MDIFYAVAIRFYGTILRCIAPFNSKAKEWVVGRKVDFTDHSIAPEKDVWWFHCASLGEFDMALPIMEAVKERKPDVFLLVTFFSPSGMLHHHKRRHSADLVLYIPLDTRRNAEKFIAHFHPCVAVFVKYEFWTNHIKVAKMAGTKVISVCASFRKSHRFFQWYGGFFRKTLQMFDFFYLQNETSARLLSSINLKNYEITGDTRFDRVLINKNEAKRNHRIEDFLSGERAILLGSTWPPDEDLWKTYMLTHPDQKFIIAPHDISNKRVDSLFRSLREASCLYTSEKEPHKHILILNTIGHLSSAYQYAKLAYVGGGFSGKLHNILEPAVFGIPVVFGPKYHHFPEAEAFIDDGFGFSVTDQVSLNNLMASLMNDTRAAGDRSTAYVEKQKGATQRIIEHLFTHFY